MEERHDPVTQEQINLYLSTRGVKCPRCRSCDITGGDVDIREGYATQDVSCDECGLEWQDIYSLTDVTIYEQEDDNEDSQ